MGMQKSSRWQDVGPPSPHLGLLLTNHEHKCSCLCQEVWPLPTTGPCVEGADTRPNNHKEPLALRSVGYGHHRAIIYRPGSEAFASIKDTQVVQLIWKNIVCMFEIPQSIIIDNGPQFYSRVYNNFCNELKIINLYSIAQSL